METENKDAGIVTEEDLDKGEKVVAPGKPKVAVAEEVEEKPVVTKKVTKATVNVKEIDVGELLLKQRELEEKYSTMEKEYLLVKAEKEKIVNEKIERSITEKLLSLGKTNQMVDPEDLVTYYRSKVKLSRDGSVVLSDAPAKSLDDEIKEFLSKKPHLVSANVPKATGVKPVAQNQLAGNVSFDLNTKEGLAAYARSLLKK